MSLEQLETARNVTAQVVAQLLRFCREPRIPMEIIAKHGLTHRPTFLYSYLQPALVAGLNEMNRPDASEPAT